MLVGVKELFKPDCFMCVCVWSGRDGLEQMSINICMSYALMETQLSHQRIGLDCKYSDYASVSLPPPLYTPTFSILCFISPTK